MKDEVADGVLVRPLALPDLLVRELAEAGFQVAVHLFELCAGSLEEENADLVVHAGILARLGLTESR
jgi:hypothetical protein